MDKMFQNIAKFNNTNDYLPLLNGVLITDLLVILLLNTNIIQSQVLKKWYSQYNLSAVIADVLIIFIGLIIVRAIFYFVFNTFSIFKFIILAIIVQIIHDILFYVFFSNIPRGVNKMLDTFKDYAKEVSYNAIISDSMMMVSSCLIGSYLTGQSLNNNIIVLIVSLYVLPYFVYN
jgi:UDP-N-acetylglucosamine transferase subunit ALG13